MLFLLELHPSFYILVALLFPMSAPVVSTLKVYNGGVPP